jgi:2-oxoglutarate dehydrogenase E2 component (dihydrolipoamide succinyltransferase)
MAIINVIMPKLGESIMEATVLKLHKQVGDKVQLDETLMDIATDKVDSEVPSTVEGVIEELLCKENDVITIGSVIARIRDNTPEKSPSPVNGIAIEKNTGLETTTDHALGLHGIPASDSHHDHTSNSHADHASGLATDHASGPQDLLDSSTADFTELGVPYQPSGYSIAAKQEGGRFYSPLVMNIAAREGIPLGELERIPGTGNEGRLTKNDLLYYLNNRYNYEKQPEINQTSQETWPPERPASVATTKDQGNIPVTGNVEIIEMDRMKKLISDHMTKSKATSAHVTSFAEADVTQLVKWRESVKKEFEKREGEKITYTPIFIEAIVRCLKKFPMLNSSVVGDKIIVKKDINIGMATALPNGNLIVPVIKHADQLNIIGLTKQVNRLSGDARKGKLQPNDAQDGTFTFTNIGTFGSLMGTPIINQPQVAVLATGAIKKKPVVIESDKGDSIAIRHMMYVSMSYDHRIIDGGLGSAFLEAFVQTLEGFDASRSF